MDDAVLQCREQGVLIDDAAAGGVDQRGAWPHQGELVSTYKVPRLRCERDDPAAMRALIEMWLGGQSNSPLTASTCRAGFEHALPPS